MPTVLEKSNICLRIQTQTSTLCSEVGHWVIGLKLFFEARWHLNHQTGSLRTMGPSHDLKCDSTVVLDLSLGD